MFKYGTSIIFALIALVGHSQPPKFRALTQDQEISQWKKIVRNGVTGTNIYWKVKVRFDSNESNRWIDVRDLLDNRSGFSGEGYDTSKKVSDSNIPDSACVFYGQVKELFGGGVSSLLDANTYLDPIQLSIRSGKSHPRYPVVLWTDCSPQIETGWIAIKGEVTDIVPEMLKPKEGFTQDMDWEARIVIHVTSITNYGTAKTDWDAEERKANAELESIDKLNQNLEKLNDAIEAKEQKELKKERGEY